MELIVKNLSATISEVIEELALMMIEPVEEEVEYTGDVLAWIDFSGPVNGRLSTRCGDELGIVLASSLLGIAPEDAQAKERACDALGEMLNVICGNLVTKLFDVEKAFVLSMPQVIRMNQDDPDGSNQVSVESKGPWKAQESCAMLLDDQRIEFTLSIASGAAESHTRKEIHHVG